MLFRSIALVGSETAALLVGSCRNGFLASRGYNQRAIPGGDEIIAPLERLLGPQRWAEATARGAAMDYDELLTVVIAALGDASSRVADPASDATS